jgi:hypothetical protein
LDPGRSPVGCSQVLSCGCPDDKLRTVDCLELWHCVRGRAVNFLFWSVSHSGLSASKCASKVSARSATTGQVTFDTCKVQSNQSQVAPKVGSAPSQDLSQPSIRSSIVSNSSLVFNHAQAVLLAASLASLATLKVHPVVTNADIELSSEACEGTHNVCTTTVTILPCIDRSHHM